MVQKKFSEFATIDAGASGIFLPVTANDKNYTLPFDALTAFLSAKIAGAKVIVLTQEAFDALPAQDPDAVYIIQNASAPSIDTTPGVRFAGTFANGTSYKNGDIVKYNGLNWLFAGNTATTQVPAASSGWIALS